MLRGGQRVKRYVADKPTVCGVVGGDTIGHDEEHPAGTVMVRSLRARPDGGTKPELCAEIYDAHYGPRQEPDDDDGE